MRIALTGATGFLGRYIAEALLAEGHEVRAWKRATSEVSGFPSQNLTWCDGELGNERAIHELVEGADAVVHSAFWKVNGQWSPDEDATTLATYLDRNLGGSFRLMKVAKEQGIKRFISISTCAVFGRILTGRPLDETHPLLPSTTYGACKAAIEAFAWSLATDGWPITCLRPPGIYGLATPARESKFFDTVKTVLATQALSHASGGKMVHASDVAQAVLLLLSQPTEAVAGEAFNCYDRFISDDQVAAIVGEQMGFPVECASRVAGPKNEIDSRKLRVLGMQFGGETRLRDTVRQLIGAVQAG